MSNTHLQRPIASHKHIDGRASNPSATIRLEYMDAAGVQTFNYPLVKPESRKAIIDKLFWLARVNIPATLTPIHNGKPVVKSHD